MQKPLISFAGNHLGDNVRSANVFDFEASRLLAGGSSVTSLASSEPGVLTAPYGLMDFIPQAEAGGANATLVIEHTPAAGGSLPVRGLTSPGVSVPAAGYYLTFVQSFPMIQLDVPRSIYLSVLATGGTPSAAFVLTAQCADFWGNLFTVTQTVPAGLVATTNYDLFKSAKYVKSISVSAGTGCPIWVGVGPTFGMDYYTPAPRFLTRASYAETSLNINTGGAFVTPPLITDVPSPISADVRGAITIAGGSAAIDGVSALNVQYVIYGGTAQAANNYTPPATPYTLPPVYTGGQNGFWTQVPNSIRVFNILGAPQYYQA